ncbi:NDMA-dependent alcohol dehydrogenase [subsurface metagenome]
METKAAVFRQVGQPLSIETLELDEPKENEVVVKVVACGVCHSDLSIITGDALLPLPIVLGHEVAGIVEKVGTRVTKLRVGDHVICLWLVPCGKCFQCLNGNETLCEASFPYSFSGTLLDGTSRLKDKQGNTVAQLMFTGGFSQYTVTPEDSTIPIAKDVPLDKIAIMGCCVPTGYGAVVNAAKVKPHSSVAVFGCGGVGLSAINAAALVSASPLIAVDIESAKQKIAMDFGATYFIDSTKEDPVAKILELTAGRGADYAFECAGVPEAQLQAFGAIRPGGMLVLAGLSPMAATIAFPSFFCALLEKKVVGTLYGSIKVSVDIPKLIDLYMAGAIKLDKMVVHKIKLEQINEAFDAMMKRQIVGRWVVTME